MLSPGAVPPHPLWLGLLSGSPYAACCRYRGCWDAARGWFITHLGAAQESSSLPGAAPPFTVPTHGVG